MPSVGRSSAMLYPSKRIFGGGFELVGVSPQGKKPYAVVKLSGDKGIHQIRINDRFGAALVVSISEAGVVLKVADEQHVIPVGGQFIPKSKV